MPSGSTIMSPCRQSIRIHRSSKSRTSKYPARHNASLTMASSRSWSDLCLRQRRSSARPDETPCGGHQGSHDSVGGLEQAGLTAALQHKSDLLVSVQVLLKEGLDLLLVVGQLLWGHCDHILHSHPGCQ